MRISTLFRLALASAAFMLSLPSVAASHAPARQTPTKPAHAGASRSVAAKRAGTAPAGQLAMLAPAATAEEPTSPQTVTLTGVVLLADGQPCPGASVFMTGAPRQVAVTDARGAFALPVPAGSPLAIQADYFGVGSTRLALDKPNTQPLRLTLGR